MQIAVHFAYFINNNMSRSGRTHLAQMRKLLDILSEDGILENGNVNYKITSSKVFWRRVAAELNAVNGGVTKNSYKWSRMWSDWKTKTKKKANMIAWRKKNNQPIPTELTTIEKRLLKTINYHIEDKDQSFQESAIEDSWSADEYPTQYLNEEYITVEGESGEDQDSETGADYEICNVMLKEEENTSNIDGSDHTLENDTQYKTIVTDKTNEKSRELMDESRVTNVINLENKKLQQRDEELRLKAIELKLKGDELKLKEVEMNKINYLTTIEEEKLKCFKDISATLKELLARTKKGNQQLQKIL